MVLELTYLNKQENSYFPTALSLITEVPLFILHVSLNGWAFYVYDYRMKPESWITRK